MEDPLVNSSSFRNQCNYDVFLSFTGQDTRHTFTGHLYNALCQKGIRTFIDDEELKRGEQISPALIKAIGQSKISIIIFSKNYAFSSWCLDELVNIIQCKTKGQLVWPVFYNVDPSEVRHQKGSFQRAMAKHERRFKSDPTKIQKWRLALTEAANLSGWHFTDGYEFKFIQRIIEAVSSLLNRTPLYVVEHPVGLERRLSDLRLRLSLDCQDVQMVGIYGLGGVGKTTLALALYNKIADQFEGASFVANVREISLNGGLLQLLEVMLGEVLGEENIKLANVNKGISIIKERFCSKKVLLIIDDVQKPEHLEKLAGGLDWFGPGSRIIVTTRDKHLLITHGVNILYEMEYLSHNDAVELFCWHAFKSSKPKPGYEDDTCRAVWYANGLPLALKVIGCNLCGKGLDEWKCALDKYKKIPPLDIQNKLKMSYDDLEENEKEIFLDLACFFKGEKLKYVERLLDACGFYPKSGIGILLDKCLITIEYNKVKMHDLVQEMGREIVTQNLRSNPGERSRLWFHDDILQVLTNNMGTHKIEAIIMNPYNKQEVHWSGNAFRKMPNLRMLVVRNTLFSMGPLYLPNSLRILEWVEYPSPSLPEDFCPKKLVMMCLPTNHLVLFKLFKGFKSLTYMDFSESELLTDLPDMSTLSSLTTLLLDNCENLVGIHDSVGFLCKLVTLSASDCSNLERFPREIRLTSLEYLNLRSCLKLQYFPNVLEKMENTLYIDLSFTAIKVLPSSMGKLSALQVLKLYGSKNLRNLPLIGMLTNLTSICLDCSRQVAHYLKSNHEFGQCKSYFLNRLELSFCDLSDEELPVLVHCFPNMEYLSLKGNNMVKLPACFKELYQLKYLMLDFCKLLEEIQGVPPNLVILSRGRCPRLRLTSELSNMPEISFEVPCGDLRARFYFNHYLGERKMCFWFRKKFPDLPLCLSIYDVKEIMLDIRIHLNGVPFRKASLMVNALRRGWCTFIHLHSFIEDKYISEKFETFEWNHVEIFFEPRYEIWLGKMSTISYASVYVYGKKPDTEDILLGEPESAPDPTSLFRYAFTPIATSSCTTEEFNPIPNEQWSASGQGNGTIVTGIKRKRNQTETKEDN